MIVRYHHLDSGLVQMREGQAGVPCLRMILEIRDRNNFEDKDFFGAAVRLNGVDIDDAVLVVKSVASPRVEDVLYALDIKMDEGRKTPSNLIFQNLDNGLREVLGKRKKFKTTRARLENMIGSLDGVIGFDPFGEGEKNDHQGRNAESKNGNNTNLEKIKQRRNAAVRKFDEKIVAEKLKAKAKEIEITGKDNLLEEEVAEHSVEPESGANRDLLIAHLNNWMGYQEENKEEIFKNLEKNLQNQIEREKAREAEKRNMATNQNMSGVPKGGGYLALRANSAHMDHSRAQILKLGQAGLQGGPVKDEILVNNQSGRLERVAGATPDAILNRIATHTPHVLTIPINNGLRMPVTGHMGHGGSNHRVVPSGGKFNPYLVGSGM